MALILNVSSEPSTTYTLAIEDSNYVFTYNWMDRLDCWHMDMRTQSDEVIALGAKLVVGVPLIRNNKELAPSGNLYLVKTSGLAGGLASRHNIGSGKDYELRYYSLIELNNLFGEV